MSKAARQTLISNIAGFGAAVDLSQDASFLAVGAPRKPHGSATMFEFIELEWREQHRIQPTDATERFGESIAVDRRADFVAIGDPGQEAVYLYAKQGNRWVQVRKLISPAAGGRTEFGAHLDLAYDAKTLIVGAKREEDGAVYIYGFEDGDWTSLTRIVPPDLSGRDDFGITVGISNDGRRAIVGSPETTEIETFMIQDDSGPPPPPSGGGGGGPPPPLPTIPIMWVFVGAAYSLELVDSAWTVTGKAINKTRPVPSLKSQLDAIPLDMRYDLVRSRLGAAVAISGDGGRVALGSDGGDIFGLYSHKTRNLGVNTWESTRMSFYPRRVAMPNNGLEIIAGKLGAAVTYIRSPALGSWFFFYTLQAPTGARLFGRDVTMSGDGTVRFAGAE